MVFSYFFFLCFGTDLILTLRYTEKNKVNFRNKIYFLQEEEKKKIFVEQFNERKG